DTDHDEARFRLGYTRLQLGDYGGAAEALNICVRRRADWLEARLNAGLAHWKLGQLDEACSQFEQAVAIQPKSTGALRGLAGGAVERNDLERALPLHRKLIELGERTPELLYNTGLLSQKSGEHQSA